MRSIKPDSKTSISNNSVLDSVVAHINNDSTDNEKVKPTIVHNFRYVYFQPNVTIDEDIAYLIWINGYVHTVAAKKAALTKKWRCEIATSGSHEVGYDELTLTGYCTHSATWNNDDQYILWAMADDENRNFRAFMYTLVPRTSYTAVIGASKGSPGTFTLTDAYKFREGADVCVTANNSEKNYGTITSIPDNNTLIIDMWSASSYWAIGTTDITSTVSSQITQLNRFFPWNGRTDSADLNDRVAYRHYRLIDKVHDERGQWIRDVQLPIGSIIAWHRALGVLVLPDGWEECDGSTVKDRESAMYGVTKPDLNGEGRFLRGNATSGIMQDATHVYDNPGTGSLVVGTANTTGIYNSDGTFSHSLQYRDVMSTGSGVTTVSNYYATRPINMSVVWIIKTR